MESCKKKIGNNQENQNFGKYETGIWNQENWNYGKCGKQLIVKYQEN